MSVKFSDVKLDVLVDIDDVTEGLCNVLHYVRPQWKRDDVTFKKLSSGLCNAIFVCSVANEDDPVLARICTSTIDARLPERYQIVHSMLNTCGLGPRVLCHFRNGTCMEFVRDNNILLNSQQTGMLLRCPKLISKMARCIARYHTRDMLALARRYNVAENFTGRYHDDNKKLVYALDELELSDQYAKALPTAEEFLFEESRVLEASRHLNPEVAFCHMDFHPYNMLFVDDEREVVLIDYDWSAISYVALDISYLLLWFPDFAEPKREDLVDDAYIREFSEVYLKHRRELERVDKAVTGPDVNQLAKQIKVFYLMSMLRFANVGNLLIAYCGQTERVLRMSKFYWDVYLEMRDSVLETARL